jgi:hypothetical protein
VGLDAAIGCDIHVSPEKILQVEAEIHETFQGEEFVREFNEHIYVAPIRNLISCYRPIERDLLNAKTLELFAICFKSAQGAIPRMRF